MQDTKCTNCRRAGVKLFLKGERCFSQKCPMIKRAFAPGQKGKRRPRPLSEYGKELREKQKLKNWYNLREKQFSNYVKSVLIKKQSKEDPALLLVRKLESRLDNVVFKTGFASSREQSRQLVSHGHIMLNGRKVNIPSCAVKNGDVVAVSLISQKKNAFKDIANILKKYKPPSWIKLDVAKLEGKITGEPSLDEASLPVEMQLIFEFYSK